MGKFVFDAEGNITLQFMDFKEWVNFIYYCEVHHVTTVSRSREEIQAVMARDQFEGLPRAFREAFQINDSVASKKIMKTSQTRKKLLARFPRLVARNEMEDQKIIYLLLPPELMPRVE